MKKFTVKKWGITIRNIDGGRSFSSINATNGIILVKILSNKVDFYVEGVLKKTDNHSMTKSRIGFRLSSVVGSMINLKILDYIQ